MIEGRDLCAKGRFVRERLRRKEGRRWVEDGFLLLVVDVVEAIWWW